MSIIRKLTLANLKENRNRTIVSILGVVLSTALILAVAFLLYKPETIEPYVKIAVGGVTIVMSLVNLVQTLKIEKKKDWKFVVSVAGAVAMAALGVFMIVADEAGIAVAQRSIGAILMLNALANIWYIAQLHRKTKEMKKEVKKAVA